MKIMWKLPVNPSVKDTPKEVIITRETMHNWFWVEKEGQSESMTKKGDHYSGTFHLTEQDALRYILRHLEAMCRSYESRYKSAMREVETFKAKYDSVQTLSRPDTVAGE